MLGRKTASPDIAVDLRHVADVLSRIKSPWNRYQLTMMIDLCAETLESEQRADRKTAKRAARSAKKTAGRRN